MVRARLTAGFSVAELLVAVVLLGILMTGLGSVLLRAGRHLSRQTVELGAAPELRVGASYLASELRELSQEYEDLRILSLSSIAYRAMRSLSVVCSVSGGAQPVFLVRRNGHGQRPPDPKADSITVFARDEWAPGSGRWVSADLVQVTADTCPDGAAARGLWTEGIAEDDLASISVGAPLRTFEMARLRSYRDRTGQTWVGVNRFVKARRQWSAIQPVFGPVTDGGLVFEFRDGAGNPSVDPASVASVGFTLEVPVASGRRRVSGRVFLRN